MTKPGSKYKPVGPMLQLCRGDTSRPSIKRSTGGLCIPVRRGEGYALIKKHD